uniref:peroxidase n=1 Tax=Tanacetum cinerariifolium TaxID=118510 RepID=A0A6L2P471_TANCI|nr:peroxidase 31-like [Tanacetum cinerariifolium]
MQDTTTNKQIASPTTAGAALRLFFHDCLVEGCDASVLISSTHFNKAERDADINLSLPGDGFAKTALELACPGVVSCADILAVATRNLVTMMGGPFYQVKLGRRDGMVSRAARAETILPKPTMSMNQIIKIFSNIGLSVQEMVALTGAHTIGFSHCSEISHDIYNYSRTQMSDPSYNTRYADGLRNACKDFKKNPSLSVFNDIMTPHDFDNSYYKNLPKGLGVLRSDRAMMMDVRTRKYVELYARDQKAFFDAFGRAIEKLSLVGVKSGRNGQIRLVIYLVICALVHKSLRFGVVRALVHEPFVLKELLVRLLGQLGFTTLTNMAQSIGSSIVTLPSANLVNPVVYHTHVSSFPNFIVGPTDFNAGGDGYSGPSLVYQTTQVQPIHYGFAPPGASSHLNDSVTSLSDIFNMCIYPSVLVGDGHSISATNTGHSILPTPTIPLHLNNVLITPNIVKNLIYVRQFVRDNNCTVEFDVFGFLVKDFMTRRVLLRCDSTGYLYPVTNPSPIPDAFFTSQHTWHQRLGHPGMPRPADTNIVRCVWLFHYKYLANGTLSRYKDQLVSNGSTHVTGIDVDGTFSPVVKPGTIRTVLSLPTSRHWPIHQLDVKNAFLHGDLSETVYMHQPLGFQDSAHPDYICLLQRSLYGLKQAHRAWFQRFASYITRVGFHHSRCDSSLFIYRHGTYSAYLLLYVDDIVLTASSETLLHQIIRMFLSQCNYAIEILERAHMVNCNPTRTLVDTESKLGDDGDPVSNLTLYQSLAGSLRYFTFTRLDISYAVHQVCLYMHDPREPYFSALKRILRAEAEYRGVANAVVETCWLMNLLRELHTYLSFATLVYYDNIRVLHVPSRYQHADIFTKGLPSALFEEFRTSLSKILDSGSLMTRPLIGTTPGEGISLLAMELNNAKEKNNAAIIHVYAAKVT